MNKLMLGAAALVMAAAPLAASAAPYGHGGDYHSNRDNGGAALAAGLFGFVLGAAVSSANQDNGYHQSYYDQRPYAYEGRYVERCEWQTRAVRGPWGRVHYQQVQVCR